MTCRQLGGSCDLALTGETGDAVIKIRDAPLKEAVAGGDTSHATALGAMRGRWKHPIAGIGWYRLVEKDFAALPRADARRR